MRRPDADPADESARPARGADPTLPVIGARLLGLVALVAALGIGQWARWSFEAPGGVAGSATVFGLSSARVEVRAAGRTLRADERAYGETAWGAAGDAAGTTKTLGLAVGGLVFVALLLVGASLGHTGARPTLGRCASFALLASVATALVGFAFVRTGLPGAPERLARDVEAVPGLGATLKGLVPTATPGSSFYAVVLAVILLAIAEAAMRVASVDDARKDRRHAARRARR